MLFCSKVESHERRAPGREVPVRGLFGGYVKVYYSTSFSNGEKIGTYDRVNNNGGETNGDYSLLIQEGKTATVTVSDDTGVIATYVVTTTGLTVKE